MDVITCRNKTLQKEVERLTTLLQLSERKRFNQKVLYDKNLENLHEKLADFENVLNKERKEIQLLIQKKDQQIKVREDLAKALQGKLDSQYCRQCGYPTSKNQFDTDWEIGIDEGKKSEKYRKLPPLSLPLPEILPNVSFSNRLTHSKSKLSPVAEESEVASSSYLRNIHADQNPDRFHAVLTASLECLQVDKQSKKNITPESEYPEEAIGTPTSSAYINPNLPPENQCVRKLDLAAPPLEETRAKTTPYCRRPRPSIVIDAYDDDVKVDESRPSQDNISEYANGVALSILEIAYRNLQKYRDEKKTEKEKSATNKCLQAFSDKLALGILTRMTPDVRTSREKRQNHRQGSMGSLDGNEIDHPGPSLDDFDTSSECNYDYSPKLNNGNDVSHENKFSFEENSFYDNRHECGEKDGIPIDNLTEKPRSYARGSPGSPMGGNNKPSYSRLSTMVVPLVDQAITVAKTIVRRRSSTNFLAIDDSNNGGEMKEKCNEKVDDSTDISTENLSFHRKTLIELIDQAVEQVIPTVNCSKDGDADQVIPTTNCSKDDDTEPVIPKANCSKDDDVDQVIPTENRSKGDGVEQVIPTINSTEDYDRLNSHVLENGIIHDDQTKVCEKHNDTNGLVFNHCDPTVVAFNEDDPNEEESLSTTIVSESNATENKETEISKSKKKKNKKKKRKKRASVSDAGNRLPESVDQMEAASVNITENGENKVITTDCALDCSFDANDVITSSLNNSETEINTLEPDLDDCDQDKFSLLVDQSFNEMEASRGSTPDTLDGFQ